MCRWAKSLRRAPVVSFARLIAEAEQYAYEFDAYDAFWDGDWCGCINCGECLGHDPPDVSRWLPPLATLLAA